MVFFIRSTRYDGNSLHEKLVKGMLLYTSSLYIESVSRFRPRLIYFSLAARCPL